MSGIIDWIQNSQWLKPPPFMSFGPLSLIPGVSTAAEGLPGLPGSAVKAVNKAHTMTTSKPKPKKRIVHKTKKRVRR